MGVRLKWFHEVWFLEELGGIRTNESRLVKAWVLACVRQKENWGLSSGLLCKALFSKDSQQMIKCSLRLAH
jgi:hypothetical protein